MDKWVRVGDRDLSPGCPLGLTKSYSQLNTLTQSENQLPLRTERTLIVPAQLAMVPLSRLTPHTKPEPLSPLSCPDLSLLLDGWRASGGG